MSQGLCRALDQVLSLLQWSLGSRFHPTAWDWQALFLLWNMGAHPVDGAGSTAPASQMGHANIGSMSAEGKLLLLLLQTGL